MTTPAMAGAWRHYATMRRGAHVATVTRTTNPTYQAGALYVVAVNGAARRSFPSWREATAYAAHALHLMPLPLPTIHRSV